VSILSDGEIVEALRTRFIPIAVDQHDRRREKDAEGEFFAKILAQAGRGLEGTSQGFYFFSPAGKLLEFENTLSADRMKRMLDSALRKYEPKEEVPAIEEGAKDERFDYKPPQGGLVVTVTSKVLGGYGEPKGHDQAAYQSALGLDHLWLRKDECEALAKGELPESVKTRIARYHLVDNTRGEPPFWKAEDVKRLELTLRDGRLSGSVRFENAKGDRGYDAQLSGIVEAKDGKVTRFDVVARGDFWGEGTYTRGAPKGKFPLAVALTVATGKDESDHAPPGGARGNLKGYLR
jgi:hypothetical protein